jgi:hypothetical protein
VSVSACVHVCVCVHNLFSSSKKKIKLWSYERRHAIMHAFALSISFGM